eukprot:TRINITY_DN15901_c0_g2_i3.p1 TRINITY_DN15901_c0_g2~~TRINITY_DN15901_c0_g2_i3.p1  ORF type:complete len:121 (+),score=24.78 TRINITY_DN15901_c0_g2_i3:36-398(+)
MAQPASAPAQPVELLVSVEMQQRHDKKECRPCAYFAAKADGCRQGAHCQFCHLCDKGALKAYKKDQKRKARKEHAERENVDGHKVQKTRHTGDIVRDALPVDLEHLLEEPTGYLVSEPWL